jgi:hypothetical protein
LPLTEKNYSKTLYSQMSILKKLFGKKEEPIKSYSDFWTWFQNHKNTFFDIVKEHRNVESDFFDKLSPKLSELKEGYFCVTGMYDSNTAELVITADGSIKNIVFVEELIEQSPKIDGWKFTALKPALSIENVNINMAGHQFNKDNLFFYSNERPEYPDEIDISIFHNDLDIENRQQITNGVYIFLDNYLGELDSISNIDNLIVIGNTEIEKELIPIHKLKDFLTWRQKEFVEKYEGVRYDTENDEHSILEAELQSGNMLLAVINTQVLKWDRKASHPWIAVVTIKYDGSNNNGLPANNDYEALNKIEEEIMLELKDKEGYINIGRQTAEGEREIYFACKEFRKPSKILFKTQVQYSNDYEIDYDIYKDKYWRSLERFNS